MRFVASLALCVSMASGVAVASAQEGAAFFKDKTVTYVVATSAGGGYDFYGRLVARYMAAALPGSTFVVKNVPGAGHMLGANYIYGSKPDGLTMGTFNPGLIFSQIIGGKGVKFDLNRMSWIGKATSEQRIMLTSTTSPFKTFADVRAATAKDPVKVSVGGVGSNTYIDAMLIAKAFDLHFKLIPGYSGNENEMAMRRGEIDANFGSIGGFQSFVKNGYGIVVLQTGGQSEPRIPHARELAQTPEAKSMIALIDAQSEIGRLTAGPPAVPAERLATLRAAYKSALENPELREKAAKARSSVTPLYGEDVAKLIHSALDQTPDMVAFITEITQADGGKK